jgi:hypothetical protein
MLATGSDSRRAVDRAAGDHEPLPAGQVRRGRRLAVIVPASSPTDYKARAEHREAAGRCAEELAKREMAATDKAGSSSDEAVIPQ